MEVKPGTGYGNFIFGMSQEEVVSIKGDADQINDINEESDQYIIYYYYDDQVKLYFDKDRNYRLYSIETFHKKAQYLNTEIIDISEKDLRTLLFRNKLKYDIEEYPSFNLFYIPSHQVYINVEIDKVRSVEAQPMFKEKKVVWPK